MANGENKTPTTVTHPAHPMKGQKVTVVRGEGENAVTSPPFALDTFGKKSPHAGKEFLTPDVDEKNVNEWMKWMGIEDVVSVIGNSLRRIFAGIHTDNLKNPAHEGKYVHSEWLEDAADFSAGRETLSDIEDSISELQETIEKLMDDPKFGEVDANGVATPAYLAIQEQMKDAHTKIKPLRVKREQIQAVYAARVQKRKEAKLAAEAEAKAKGQTAPATA